MIFCVDIDGSLDTWPEQLGVIMRGLEATGHEVHILSGHRGDAITQQILQEKATHLHELGLGDTYSKLVGFASPKNKVASQKVDYMQRAGASVLIDNNKHNVKAASKAGFLALRVGKKH